MHRAPGAFYQFVAAVVIAGVLCGLGGAYLSVGQAAGFLPLMTAGKGFIALAALIFAKWRAWPAFWTCLLFGLLGLGTLRSVDKRNGKG